MSRWSLLPVVGCLALVSAGCSSTPATGVARGQAIYDRCSPCHGADGSGNQELGAPAIAGAPEWYVQAQLHKFKSGLRAYHVDDVEGLRMRPMLLGLMDENDLNSVAAYVASMPAVNPPATVQGDAAKGQVSYALCLACHGPDASGNQALSAPPLKHLQDWYVVKQLSHFKSGMRGNPGAFGVKDANGAPAVDLQGTQMLGMAATLVDEQAMKDVAAYINGL